MSTVEQLPAVVDLAFVRGDTFSREFQFYIPDDDGDLTITLEDGSTISARVPDDFADWELAAQTRETPNSRAFEDFDIAKDDDTGVVTVTLTDEQTADLPGNGGWDFERRVDDTTLTIISGAMRVPRDYTRDEGGS